MPASMVFTLTDPYEDQHAFRAGNMDRMVTEAGDYRTEVKRLDFNRLWMPRSSYNLPFVAHASLNTGRVGFSILAHYTQPPVRMLGRVSIPFIDDCHVRTSAESCWASMSLAVGDLAEAGRYYWPRYCLSPRDEVSPTATASRVQTNEAASGGL